MATKRPVNVEGNTPGKPEKKRPTIKGTSRKTLFSEEKVTSSRQWSVEETVALTQYICLFWEKAHTNKWPTISDAEFWNACANAVNTACKSTRTGPSCRTRVTKHLSKEFSTLSEAEDALNIDYMVNSSQLVKDSNPSAFTSPPRSKSEYFTATSTPLSPIFGCSPNPKCNSDSSKNTVGDSVKEFLSCFQFNMSERLKTQLIQHIFELYIAGIDGPSFVQFLGKDFVTKSLSGMRNLFNKKKKNIIYELCQCLEGPSPRMPLDRMPFGMIDYNIRFFASENTVNVRMEEHYASWLETMFAQFGHKWLCLHRGPVWQYDDISEAIEEPQQNVVTAEKLSFNQDIIQEALQQSSVNLEDTSNLNLDYDSLELISSSMYNMCISVNDFSGYSKEILLSDPESSTTYAQNQSTDDCSVSHLWSSIPASYNREIETGLVSPVEMEKFHDICPTIGKTNNRLNTNMYNPLKSKVNVASLGARQIQKRVKHSPFSKTVDIQVEALKTAKECQPNGRWWIKADGCDVRNGLRESIRGTWAGDVDLGDGLLQRLFAGYKLRRSFIKSIGTAKRLSMVFDDVREVLVELGNDLDFLKSGVQTANKVYAKALEGKSSEQTLMELSWSAVGFEELVKKCFGLRENLNAFLRGDESVDLVLVKCELLDYLKGVFSKKRVAATHLLVFMVADELRNQKPYAIPVRFMPYKSLTDAKLRELEIELENSMREVGMTVVGFTTDGEFNSLRTNGVTRPVSVIELIKNAKNEARGMTVKTITSFFKLDNEGNPLFQHAAVPLEEVMWLNGFIEEQNISFERAVYLLRRKLFPFMHDPLPWVEGKSETTGDILKSIMSIFLYRKSVEDLKHHPTDPADFMKYLYQPEKDVNGERIHHREDHNHLLKRIVSRLRGGHIPGIDLRHLRDALHDPKTGLTYEALTGKNKQSVPDCERLISPGVIAFLEQNGHDGDAIIIKRIHNWHKAVDGRGLSETERSLYCREMKEWLLDDWMPWFRNQPDFKTIDVNRKIKGICGLTKEVVIGLIANLESRALRRVEYQARDLPPEHPRASGTDDVEGMIGLLHDMLGDIFDMKQFLDAQPKILNEFNKRIDPDLPFYYWTGSKERYTDLELPSFNQLSGDGIKERLDKVKVSRRGDPGVFVANRASLPQKGQLTARAKFHRDPVALPPPPSQD